MTDTAPETPTGAALEVLSEVLAEMSRAKVKHPLWPTDPQHALNVVAEELGETLKNVIQCAYEPDRSSAADVRHEAVQMAAMALRFLEHIDRYEFIPGREHEA